MSCNFGNFLLDEGIVVFMPLLTENKLPILTEDDFFIALEDAPSVIRLSAKENMNQDDVSGERTVSINFNHNITILPNRVYESEVMIFDGGFIKKFKNDASLTKNNILIDIISGSTENIEILGIVEYVYPLSPFDPNIPFPDFQEYQYTKDGLLYCGLTNKPVDYDKTLEESDDMAYYCLNEDGTFQNVITGTGKWQKIKIAFRTKENNIERQTISLGIKIKTDYGFDNKKPLFIKDFKYKGADILVQDKEKQNRIFETSFDEPFIGGLQKLRIYNKALNSRLIIHNATKENINSTITKGGRLIYK